MNEYYIKFEIKGKFSIQTDVWQYIRVSEWLLFNANSAIFSYIMARTS